MEKEIKKAETLKIKFNAFVFPKVKWSDKTNKFESIASQSNFRNDVIKLKTEKGDTPEETKYLQEMKTGTLMSNHMLTIQEGLDILYGNLNDREARQFYFKDEIVELPKIEAEYYLNSYCGGEITIRNADKVMEKTHHLMNIDGRPQFYEKRDAARFKREHVPLMVAEIYHG